MAMDYDEFSTIDDKLYKSCKHTIKMLCTMKRSCVLELLGVDDYILQTFSIQMPQ
jgi:hypothetical protein